jgi:hypothetical protein
MSHVRSLFLLAPSLLVPSTASAQSDVRPAPSGRATSEVVLSKPVQEGQDPGPEYRIRLDWGQPHLRGRALHSDSLVPYGTPWRTGANAPTTLTTEVDLVFGGAALPRGKYVLFTLPGREGWTLLIQRDVNQGGEYKSENDVARVELNVRPLAGPLESLTFWLIPAPSRGASRGELRMAWGMTEAWTEWAVK